MIETIRKINEFLNAHTWCDFNIIDLKGNLKIGGRTSFSEKHDIIITFEDIFYIQCLYEWKTNTANDSFFISDIDEERSINLNYSIEQGYYLLKVEAEDVKHPLYISCKNITFEVVGGNG